MNGKTKVEYPKTQRKLFIPRNLVYKNNSINKNNSIYKNNSINKNNSIYKNNLINKNYLYKSIELLCFLKKTKNIVKYRCFHESLQPIKLISYRISAVNLGH